MSWILTFTERIQHEDRVRFVRRFLDGLTPTSDESEAYAYESLGMAETFLATVRASGLPWADITEIAEIPDQVRAPGWTWRIVDGHVEATDPTGRRIKLPWSVVCASIG